MPETIWPGETFEIYGCSKGSGSEVWVSGSLVRRHASLSIKMMFTVLAIAGFDPSGGAGVLADIKTFAACGCFGAAAITSITSQNTTALYGAYHQPPEVLRAQIEP